MPQIDWLELQAYLDESTPSAETDLRIEEAIAAALSTYPSESLPALIKALSISDSVFVKQRVGFAISLLAPDDSMDAANALMSVVNESKGKDSFLYAQAIGAIGTFAKRNYLANAYVSAVLLQLQPTDSPYVLVQAAKVIGQLGTNRKQGLRQVLDTIGRAEDLRVQAEVFQQKAMIDLIDAFSMETLTGLKAAIGKAQRGFKKAIESEENRDDAIVFDLLLDLIATFLDMSFSGKKLVAKKITEKNQEIIQFVNMPFRQSLRTNFEQLLNLRILHVADSFRRISQSVARSEEWTNLDQALVDLVAVCALSQAKEEVNIFQAELVSSPLEESFECVFPKIVVPKVGPILKRTVGRVRLKKIIDNYIDSNGRDAISEGLYYIYKTAVENEYAVEDSGSSEIGLQPLKKAIEERGEDSDFFISSLIESLNSGEVEKWAENITTNQARYLLIVQNYLETVHVLMRLLASS